jgi:hypothetical protein
MGNSALGKVVAISEPDITNEDRVASQESTWKIGSPRHKSGRC